MSPATVTARLVAVAVDGIIGTCAILITLMVTSQKGLAQIGSMLTDDPAAVEALAPRHHRRVAGGARLPFLFALQVSRAGSHARESRHVAHGPQRRGWPVPAVPRGRSDARRSGSRTSRRA